ncbi:MAG: hypothetical protein A3E87_01920 [Gammaproteobacteria bacterium RIFCSPHIGHO2_12_FULL_35_23]|nr:MAG: hypothetical protein A3E87_01920 [Gammaproteobacteria bacterium RIFCSPHIGHO2_12_FULL_35_23]
MLIKNELVSIIIPTYNQAGYLEECLNSILRQTYSCWEAIIINNNSTDNTLEVIKKFSDERIKVLNFSNHGIIAASRNYGVQHAKGKSIAFLDSDDLWDPYKIEKYMDIFLKKQVDLICSDVILFNNTEKKRRYTSSNKFSYSYLLYHTNKIVTSSVMLKKQVFLEANGFNENSNLVTCEDYDLWLRLAYLKKSFYSIHLPLTYYRVNEAGASRNYQNHLLATLNLLALHHKKFIKNSFLNDLRMRSRISIALRGAGYTCFKSGDWNNAIQYFLKAMKKNFFSYKVWVALSIVYLYKINFFKKAEG